MTNKRPPRKFIAVTVMPELHAMVKAEAAKRDMPITAWIREAIAEHLPALPAPVEVSWKVLGD